MLIGLIALLIFAASDLVERRIPKHFNLVLIAVTASNFSTLGNAAVLWLLYLLLFRLSRASLGYGDVRLAPVTSLITTNLEALLMIHLLAWTIGGSYCLVLRRPSRTNLPFAPLLATSALLFAVS